MNAPRAISDTECVDRIHVLLDRRSWECGTLDAIVKLIEQTGRQVRLPEYEKDDL